MEFFVNFPLFSVVLSLMCSVVCSVIPGKAARRLSLFLTAVSAVMSACVLALTVKTGESVTYMMGHYPHPWGNELHFGILEPLFVSVFSLVLMFCVIGGKKQLIEDLQENRHSLYYVMVCLINASLTVLVYTGDLFTGYVFIEICTIASCGLLMIRQIGRTTLASVRYMIFSLVGSGMFLFGVTILYNITGHLLMPNLKETVAELWATGLYRTPLTTSICLITLGLSIKSGLFPFHFWMPDTYGVATPCSSGILSGLVSKGYTFLLIKVVFDVFGTDVFYASGVHNVLYGLGFLGIIAGSLSAMHENDIFRMTAFSSAAQMGYIYMGIGISPTYGVTAALFHILTHALTKPLLFLSAAQLSDCTGGGRAFRRLQGAAHTDLCAGAAFSIGAFSMIGIPLTMGFISKYLFAVSAFNANVKLIPTLIVLAISTVLNTFYFARTVIRLYNKPNTTPVRVRMGEQKSFVFSAAMFCVINLVLGVCAQPIVSLIEEGLKLL